MKAACVLLISLLFPAAAAAQTRPTQVLDPATSREFLEQLLQDGVYNLISSPVAESLVVHRVDPVLPHGEMMARVSGAVIIAFEITKEGKVRHSMAVSGPKLLQARVLAAVRQWTFKPYPLQGAPTTIATSIPIAVSNFRGSLANSKETGRLP